MENIRIIKDRQRNHDEHCGTLLFNMKDDTFVDIPEIKFRSGTLNLVLMSGPVWDKRINIIKEIIANRINPITDPTAMNWFFVCSEEIESAERFNELYNTSKEANIVTLPIGLDSIDSELKGIEGINGYLAEKAFPEIIVHGILITEKDNNLDSFTSTRLYHRLKLIAAMNKIPIILCMPISQTDVCTVLEYEEGISYAHAVKFYNAMEYCDAVTLWREEII